MRNCTEHIVFAGGGTAGHLFPGLAVAEELARAVPGVRITFVGSGKSFEPRHVRAAGFEYATLPCQPFPRRARETIRFLADHISGYYAARRSAARTSQWRWSWDSVATRACRLRGPPRGLEFRSCCWSKTRSQAAPRAGWRRPPP